MRQFEIRVSVREDQGVVQTMHEVQVEPDVDPAWVMETCFTALVVEAVKQEFVLQLSHMLIQDPDLEQDQAIAQLQEHVPGLLHDAINRTVTPDYTRAVTSAFYEKVVS